MPTNSNFCKCLAYHPPFSPSMTRALIHLLLIRVPLVKVTEVQFTGLIKKAVWSEQGRWLSEHRACRTRARTCIRSHSACMRNQISRCASLTPALYGRGRRILGKWVKDCLKQQTSKEATPKTEWIKITRQEESCRGRDEAMGWLSRHVGTVTLHLTHGTYTTHRNSYETGVTVIPGSHG